MVNRSVGLLALLMVACSTAPGKDDDAGLFPGPDTVFRSDHTSVPDDLGGRHGKDEFAADQDLFDAMADVSDNDLSGAPDQWADLDGEDDDAQVDEVVEDVTSEIAEADVLTAQGTLEEPFQDQTMVGAGTTALWGLDGQLVPAADGFGDGSDGAFEPLQDTTLDAAAGPYQYTTITIPEGVTVAAVGDVPLELLSQGAVVIAGTLTVAGEDGADALGVDGGNSPFGGVGVAGGANGGSGSPGGLELGEDGSGTGAGKGGIATDVVTFVAPGGGGGFGSAGADAEAFQAGAGGAGGVLYGGEALDVLEGGSGGGGGGCYDRTPGVPAGGGNDIVDVDDAPGAGGGAGGGAVSVRAGGSIEVSGSILADGGDGGIGDFSGGGGGGSGGAILLETAADLVLAQGILSARGGKGNICTDTNQLSWCNGGQGGGGRIVMRTGVPLTDGLVKNAAPVPTWAPVQGGVDGGTGADGVFAPANDMELNTNAGPFYYTSVTIPEGVTVTAVGDLPLRIYSQGNLDVLGTIDVSGLQGGTGYSACCSQPGPAVAGDGGVPGPGGYRGGGGGLNGDGEDGHGPGFGSGSLGSGSPGAGAFAGGGGGGGYGEPGQVGGCPEEAAGGAVYGIHSLEPLEGGSGGGGAGLTAVAGDNPGSGGGGGGGAVHLQTGAMLLMKGTIRSNGGAGGENTGSGNGGSFGAGGGGGSGGAILVRAQSVRDYGKYEALGGPAGDLSQGGGCTSTVDVPGQGRGGQGGAGRIRFETDVPVGFIYPEEGSVFTGTYEVTWQKKAFSMFYDSGSDCPDYGLPIVEPALMADKILLSFQGQSPGDALPGAPEQTGWTSDVDDLDCYRYLQFSVEFKAWDSGDAPPALDGIKIPFTYQP